MDLHQKKYFHLSKLHKKLKPIRDSKYAQFKIQSPTLSIYRTLISCPAFRGKSALKKSLFNLWEISMTFNNTHKYYLQEYKNTQLLFL